MRQITSRVKLDIVGAVNAACNEIHLGAIGFFMDTEFGYIPIEVVHRKPKMDGSRTVKWESAPASEWVMSNRNGKYEWHVTINYIHGQNKILTKMQLIREFSDIMYRSLSHGATPTNIDLITLVSSYIHSFDGYGAELHTDRYAVEYVNATGGLGKIMKSTKNQMISEVVHHLETKEQLACINKEKYMQKLKNLQLKKGDFSNNFYDLMFIMTMSGNAIDKLDQFNELSDKMGTERIHAYDLLKFVNK